LVVDSTNAAREYRSAICIWDAATGAKLRTELQDALDEGVILIERQVVWIP